MAVFAHCKKSTPLELKALEEDSELLLESKGAPEVVAIAVAFPISLERFRDGLTGVFVMFFNFLRNVFRVRNYYNVAS